MSIKHVFPWHTLQDKADFKATAEFNEKHRQDSLTLVSGFSRRRFIRTAAGAAGVAGGILGSGLWIPARGDDDQDEKGGRGKSCPEQNAIPHINSAPGPASFGGFRFFFPGPVDGSPAPTDPEPQPAHAAGRDPATIFNFDGVIGQADLNLTGTGTDTTTGATAKYGFHTDMRFMSGKFVGTDGKVHHGTFAFI